METIIAAIIPVAQQWGGIGVSVVLGSAAIYILWKALQDNQKEQLRQAAEYVDTYKDLAIRVGTVLEESAKALDGNSRVIERFLDTAFRTVPARGSLVASNGRASSGGKKKRPKKGR